MAKVAGRLLVLAAMALMLSACGMVVSKEPVFPDQMAVADPTLEGLYTLRGASQGNVAVVTRTGSHYTATFYADSHSPDPNAKRYRETGAADFQLIPIDGGDYAVQASCAFADTGAGMFASPKDGFSYQYAVLIAARPRWNFWLGVFPGGIFEQHHIHKLSDGDTYDVSGVDPHEALALFRGWRDGLVDAGGESVSPVVRVAEQSFLTPAPDDPHPWSCQDWVNKVQQRKTDSK